MPITPFNQLRNPYSVGQSYVNGIGNGVVTGTGYAVMVRLNSVIVAERIPANGSNATATAWNKTQGINEFGVYGGDLLGTGITANDWTGSLYCQYNCGQPTSDTFTAFLSGDDYTNSDLTPIFSNPLTWQKGQMITYSFATDDSSWILNANGIQNPKVMLQWEIIEVVDEATYNAGAGVPQAAGYGYNTSITQLTYGDIPVGTMMATPGDPACNGCSSLYTDLGLKSRQGLPENNNPGHFLTHNGPTVEQGALMNVVTVPVDPWNYYLTVYDAVDTGQPLSDYLNIFDGMTSGAYVGGLYSWSKICETCRDPNAINYDNSTSPVYNTGGFYVNTNGRDPNNTLGSTLVSLNNYGDFPQQNCVGGEAYPEGGSIYNMDPMYVPGAGWIPYDPYHEEIWNAVNNTPGTTSPHECCLYENMSTGSGSGCIDPNAWNFDPLLTEDCNGLTAGNNYECCDYFHLWKVCGAHGSYQGVIQVSEYLNITGNPSNSWDSLQQNTAANNQQFMDYLLSIQGAPGNIAPGDIIHLRSMGMPGNWWCVEYVGKSPHNSDYWDTQYGGAGSGMHWPSYSWWNTPPGTDGNGDLIIDTDCTICSDPGQWTGDTAILWEVCDGQFAGEMIQVVNDWATDPQDEANQTPSGNASIQTFWNEYGSVIPNHSCSSCNQPWALVGMTMEVNWAGIPLCLELRGSGSPAGDGPNNSWIEGIGTGTDNFIRIDPLLIIDTHDNCDACGLSINTPCNPICTDPTAGTYVPGPYSTNDCECNGDPIGTQGVGWNDCCEGSGGCDDLCNDPNANNYNPAATGCCGSGPGIGSPTAEFTSGNCSSGNTILNPPLTTQLFLDYVSNQANGIAGTTLSGLQYENMDAPTLGLPIPVSGCTGPNGGYMASFGVGDGWTFDPAVANTVIPGSPGTIFTNWNDVLTQATTAAIPGVTSNTTVSELNILIQAWNPNGAGVPAPMVSPTNLFCTCTYATYGPNYDCCTYNWKCMPALQPFAPNWPTPDSNSSRANTIVQYNNRYGLSIFDANPRPESTFNHNFESEYIWPGLSYLNVPLRFTNFLNLGLHFNSDIGGQGWAGGKQPNVSYTSQFPSEWAYAYDFMQDYITEIVGGDLTSKAQFDLTKTYYRVKTNMISTEGSFVNPNAKVITETNSGGTVDTGLYYHIIPAGAIRIDEEFKNIFPTMGGVNFNSWRSFVMELRNYELPSNVLSWQDVSDWIIEKVSATPGNDVNSAQRATPSFVPSTMQFMTTSSQDCVCVQDYNGPYTNQVDCLNMLTDPNNGSDNCCACVYGCTDPNASNYNPLATCDDGSCIDCDPLIFRFCSDMALGIENYHRGYLGNPGDPQNCANSTALENAWGLQNYYDIVGVSYTDNGISYNYCVQWVDPNAQYYIDWLTLNSYVQPPNHQFYGTLPTTSGNFTYTPYDPNYSSDAQCQFCHGVTGCTDPNALNFNKNCAGATVNATIDDGCCEYCVYGCMDSTTQANGFPDINGYDNTATYDCAVSSTIPSGGNTTLCPHPCTAGYVVSNYNPCATCDDGSCETPTFHKWKECGTATEIAIVSPGSTYNDIFAQEFFWNYVGNTPVGETINTLAGITPTCYEYLGTDTSSPATALTPLPQLAEWVYNQSHNTDCTSCLCIYGCTDANSCNYDAAATCDDGTCCNETGCMDSQAFNYCPTCCCPGPCDPVVEGCMDPAADNYDPLANTPCNDCCVYTVNGCTDPTAANYNPLATVNDGSCIVLDQCKRAPREYGSDPTKKLNVECDFASDVYKEYRKQRYGLSNYCGSDLPDHLHEKQLCDWEDTKRPAYLSAEMTVLATYEYPIVDDEPNWMDPFRPAWTSEKCGLTSDVDIDIYFMYDCTSMGLTAIQQQRNAADDWIANLETPFEGEVYHVLVCGERWVDWATTIFTGQWNNSGTCGGKDSYCVVNSVAADYGACLNSGRADAVAPTAMALPVSDGAKFWLPMQWGNSVNKPWYSSAPLGYDNGAITHLGYPPALTKREVLGVFFADEAATSTGTGFNAQPYHTDGCNAYCVQPWDSATDGTGTAADGSDSVLTACYKADYDKYIEKYKAHLAKGPLNKATMVIYPAKPLGTIHASHRGFPLHALGAVDSGNKTPKDGRYATGTAPTNSLVSLSDIELGNPYWDTVNPVQPSSHTYGYGGLDNYGWFANVAEGTFSAQGFKDDLESYWDPNKLKCDGTECIIMNVVNQNNVAIPDYDIYVDGGFAGKTDEFGRVKFQIENADVKTQHIINLCLCLETKGNCRQQQIKMVVQEDCPPECCVDPTGVSCETYVPPTQVFEGCTDPNASNYNSMATVDDGTCEYCDPGMVIGHGQTDVSAAGANDGIITATVTGGTLNYTYAWTGPGGYSASTLNISGLAGGTYTLTVTDAESCTAILVVNLSEPTSIYGCMTATAGYWPNINGLNQSGSVCTYPCSDDGTNTGTPEGYLYFNYNPSATIADTCYQAGCTDANAISGSYCSACTHDCNGDLIGTNNPLWDDCCVYCTPGCMDPIAGNYNANADCDDGSCIYYWECDPAGYDINEIISGNFSLSNYDNTGVYLDNSCAWGFCDQVAFYEAMGDYYSATGNESLTPGLEVTAVGDAGGSYNMMGFFGSSDLCPYSVLNSNYPNSYQMPLTTIGGYSTECPAGWGSTASNSCYAQLQVTQFGANYIFPTWQAYVDWHNGAGGPNVICSGTQIPVITSGNDFTWANNMHGGINTGNGPYDTDPNDNWVYVHPILPNCTNWQDCECNQVFTVEDNDGFPGTNPTQQECEDDLNTCCGSGSGIGGCIDDGFVGQHADFGTYGATTEQDWWDGQNASGISYSQHNNPMSICLNGIIHEELLSNGGSGVVGTGVGGTYPVGIPALNYNPLATYDDGSCCYCSGCMDSMNSNYEVGACFNDPSLCASGAGSTINGCTDPNACCGSYNASATNDDGSCSYSGCLDQNANNYGNFEINNQPTYTWAGTTYGLSDITTSCPNCCEYNTTGNWECIYAPTLGDPEWSFYDPDTGNLTYPNNNSFAARVDLTSVYQMNTIWGTGLQTVYDHQLGNYYGPDSVMHIWSNASNTDSFKDFNTFWWWSTGATPGACANSISDVQQLYSDTGWTSPNGTVGFTVGSISPFTPNQATGSLHVRTVGSVILKRIPNQIVHQVTATDADTTWETFRDTLINVHGLDGSSSNHPDLTGLDYLQAWTALDNVTNGDFELNWAACNCVGNSNEDYTCLITQNGTHASCTDCISNTNGGCGVC